MQKWLWNWAMGRGWKNFKEHHRESLVCLEQTISGNPEIKDSVSERSEQNKEFVTENWRKESPCFRVAESSVVQKLSRRQKL